MKKYRLAILCNFGPPHVGGTEQVLENISTRLISECKYNITIFGYNYKKKEVYKGINLCPCYKGQQLIDQISKFDHILTYSDSFWGFDTLVENIDKVDCRISVALVGAYHMQSHPEILLILKKNLHKINLITHSSLTCDYKWCIDNNLPVKVIPNGVNMAEFEKSEIDIREKYNIKEKYIFLNVSNFFFGKGFEILPKIARKIRSKDFIILQFSNTVHYPYDKVFFNRTKNQCKGLPVKFIRDAPREDTISAFKQSDSFIFTSKKEIAPLVILESRAAKLPWISMNVGNTIESLGGKVINNPKEDHKGYKIVDDKIINSYIVNIVEILELKEIREKIIDQGQEGIESIDWDNIVPLYDKVFMDEI